MPELFVLGMVILACYAMIRVVTSLVASLFGSRYRAYRQLAARFHGRCESRGLVDPPRVSFSHQGALVRVGLAPVVVGQLAPPRTRVVVRFAAALPLRLELFPGKRPAPPQPPRGTRIVALGQPDFDRTYVVHANDTDIARELLGTVGIRDSLENLRKLCPPAGMLVSVNPERLLAQIDRNLGVSIAGMETAVRATLQIHDVLLSSVAQRLNEGVNVVEVSTNPALEATAPICEVCGDPITGAHMVCNLCHTPCHRDCWAFVGACSTFGCGGKQSTLVTPRAASQPQST